MLSKRMTELGSARSEIRELFEYGKRLRSEIGEDNVFDFSLGNPSVPNPAQVDDAIRRLLSEYDPVMLHGYTSAQGDLGVRSSIAESFKKRFGIECSADNFYMTVGAAAALCCCLGAMTCENDEFIVIAPFFPEYKVFIESFGGKMTVVQSEKDTFQLDIDAISSAVTPRTKGIIINSPNNPSGAVYSAESISRLCALLKDRSELYGHPIYIISDEPYREIVYSGVTVPFIPSLYDNTVVCYSWSKSLSLPGERIGYVFVPSRAYKSDRLYAAIMGAGRSLGYVNAPALFQRVCAECCELTADVSVYERNRNILSENLRQMGYRLCEPQGAFYLFLKALEPDARAFSERAKKHGLLLVPSDSFGCSGYARISFCVPTEKLERSLPAFKALADEYLK